MIELSNTPEEILGEERTEKASKAGDYLKNKGYTVVSSNLILHLTLIYHTKLLILAIGC